MRFRIAPCSFLKKPLMYLRVCDSPKSRASVYTPCVLFLTLGDNYGGGVDKLLERSNKGASFS